MPGDGVHVAIPGKGVVDLAPFGSRIVGYLIDGVILAIPSGIVYAVLIASAVSTADCVTVQTDTSIGTSCTGGGLGLGIVLAYVGLLVLQLLYIVGMIAVKGQTVGGMVMKIRAVRVDTGGVPGWGPSFLRWFAVVLGAIVCGIGAWVVLFSPLFDGNKRLQGWQDKWAKVYVVKDGPQFH
jgi:uncharacterized RDD family membrane protein YckC